ncbi:hypothetical protein MATL_G00257810 [Megalops atlanticus]|uniref:Uncharacterized protein n=1 Tax=Megalops atlanticus TaxID=7932 RepID=A0A9D3PAG5_MEGAT|nr:hypothetical protein MATL_G00257810 [Megalops atlanticus]
MQCLQWRRGQQKLAASRKQRRETGGGPSTTEDLTPAEDLAASTLSGESIEGFGGLEIGIQLQAPQAEDPHRPGTSGREQGTVMEGEAPQPSREATSRPRSRHGSIVRQEDHPFLDLQQAGFNMLERQLAAIQQGVRRVNTQLGHMEMLLQPLVRIADNQGLLVEAVERIAPAVTPAVTPPPPPPPPSTRSLSTSTRATSRSLPCPAPLYSTPATPRREEGE